MPSTIPVYVETGAKRTFVGAINRGMALGQNDVVLLNSDTVVTPGWLEKLRRCADSDARIGTISQQILSRSNLESVIQRFRLFSEPSQEKLFVEEKIDDLRYNLQQEAVGKSVLLIGKTERGPFTVLDGNHRLVAAMLASPPALDQLQFFCGLSPKMDQCCWYQTNVVTLARYGANMVRHLARDPERDLAKLMHALHLSRTQPRVLEENEDRSVAPS